MRAAVESFLIYDTPKLVRIRSPTLSVCYYLLCVGVAAWVVGFQILYGNQHFQLLDVKGRARLTIQQPTENGCNPKKSTCNDAYRPLTQLPYCEKYSGSDGMPKGERRPCIFADQHVLTKDGMMEDSMFIPTRIDSTTERKACEPSEANGWSCDKSYRVVEQNRNVYVADIERYTLLIAHSYYRKDVSGSSLDIQGFYHECRNASGAIIQTYPCDGVEEVRPIRCLPGLHCGYNQRETEDSALEQQGSNELALLQDEVVTRPVGASLAPDAPAPMHSAAVSARRRRRQVSQPLALALAQTGSSSSRFSLGRKHPGVFAIPDGDIFELGRLLQLAGLDLDGSRNKDGETLRERGTMLDVKVEYTNLHPFWSSLGFTTVGYRYRVVERPVNEMKTELYAVPQPDDFPRHRVIENRHGISLRVTVTGTFGHFDIVYLLVMLTTSLALLAAANAATEFMAKYVMKGKEEYYEVKYDQKEVEMSWK